MSNAINFGSVVVLKKLSADPASATNGSMYYNTGSNKIRSYVNGAWGDIAGTVNLTGQVLNEFNVLVGNNSNVSAAVDSNSLGDVKVDTAAGLVIKAGAVDNSKVSASAAIAYSKLSLGSSIVNSDINATAAIAYAKLALSASIVDGDVAASAAIAYAKLALGSSIVNGDISATAAIAYAKLALSASIVDGDVAASAAIAYSKLALTSSIVNADISSTAAIAYAKLALSASIVDADVSASAAIAYSKLALGSSIVNSDVAATAAIAYSKLALASSIVDADVNATAAIAYSKLALGSSIVNGDVAATAAIAESKLSLDYSTSSLNTNKVAKAGDTMASAANLTFAGGGEVLGLPSTPSGSGAAASKAYVDAVALGLAPKAAVQVATTADVVLASALINGAVVDTVTLTTGMRVLVKNQSLPEENGVYIVAASGAASRSLDMDSLTPIDEVNGAWVPVQLGSQAGQIFVQYGIVATIGVSPINFEFYNPLASLVGGDMITNSGSTFSVDLATASGLESSNPGNANGQLQVKLDGTTLSKSGSGLKVNSINNSEVSATAAIAYSKLALSASIVDADVSASAAIAYAKLALSSSIVNSDVSASAAIAYSKLALGSSIVNADVAATAAIAESKLSLDYSTASLYAVALKTITPAALAASQVTFATISALSFTSAASKSKVIQYEIVDDVTGDARTGKLTICLGAGNEVGQSDVFVSSNVAMDDIELLAVNTAGSCVVQYKGTPANACTLKVLSAAIAV